MRYWTAIATLGLILACAAEAGIVGATNGEPQAPKAAPDARPVYKIVADLTKGGTSARHPAVAEASAPGEPAPHKALGKGDASGKPYDPEAKRATPEPDVKRILMKRDPKHALQSSYGATQSIQQRKSILSTRGSRPSTASERVLHKRNYDATHARHGANKSYSNPYKAQPIRKH